MIQSCYKKSVGIVEGSPKASLPGRAHCSNSQRDESGTALPATQKRRRTKIKLMFEDDYIEPLREAKGTHYDRIFSGLGVAFQKPCIPLLSGQDAVGSVDKEF